MKTKKSAAGVGCIKVTGAREHNLHNISVSIPRRRLAVVTGPSGSGKSSLAFDTVYAEGRRRFVETLSAYARQYLDLLKKPDVDHISGLSPAVSIEQRRYSSGPRSTLGTTCEVYDCLRLLFARAGTRYCPDCRVPVNRLSRAEILDRIMALGEGVKCYLLAPVVRRRKGQYLALLERVRAEGYVKVRIDGRIVDIDSDHKVRRYGTHTIEAVIDQLIIRAGGRERVADSLEKALDLGGGEAVVAVVGGADHMFSVTNSCPSCGRGFSDMDPAMFSFNSPAGYCPACHGLGIDRKGCVCRDCGGGRLGAESMHVYVDGGSIAQLAAMPLSELQARLLAIGRRFSAQEQKVSAVIMRELNARVGFLVDIGLGYLSLNRTNNTLSGGEFQRVRLATQIGSGLNGVLYVLDEPSIGLHFRDNFRLLAALRRLTAMNNTVLVVEHDESTMRAADHIVDLGPGAGVHGGRLVFSGTPEELLACPDSLTGKYLRGEMAISGPEGGPRKAEPGRELVVEGAAEHNLKNIDARFPLGLLTCVTGVSGSGKSTLVDDILRPLLMNGLYKSGEPVGRHRAFSGCELVDKVCVVDQSPIGRSPRSNPVTYTGIFSHIRTLMAMVPESRARGYAVGRFSFNVKGGRCEACQGNGQIKVEMSFLPDVYVPCEICGGRRFNDDTLEIRYADRNIAEILDLTVEEAAVFFRNVPAISGKLAVFAELGLGYLTLGQSATTLSGGEAQRIKLAHELVKRTTGRTVFILDEPTTGLHFGDVHLLIDALHRLAGQGNTVIVIEHNLEVVKTADHVIDLGPEGGAAGGKIVACGTPAGIAACKASHTGRALKTAIRNAKLGRQKNL